MKASAREVIIIISSLHLQQHTVNNSRGNRYYYMVKKTVVDWLQGLLARWQHGLNQNDDDVYGRQFPEIDSLRSRHPHLCTTQHFFEHSLSYKFYHLFYPDACALDNKLVITIGFNFYNNINVCQNECVWRWMVSEYKSYLLWNQVSSSSSHHRHPDPSALILVDLYHFTYQTILCAMNDIRVLIQNNPSTKI